MGILLRFLARTFQVIVWAADMVGCVGGCVGVCVCVWGGGGGLDVGDHSYVWSFISCFTGSVFKKRIMMFLTHTTFYIEIVLLVYILDVAVVCSLEV